MIELIGIWIRKNKPWSWILILFIAVPVLIQMHWWPIYPLVVSITPGNHDTWIQFWGSYLGIVPSGLIAFLITKQQIQFDKEQSRKKLIIESQIETLREIVFLIHKFEDLTIFSGVGFKVYSHMPPEPDGMNVSLFLKIMNDVDIQFFEKIVSDILFNIERLSNEFNIDITDENVLGRLNQNNQLIRENYAIVKLHSQEGDEKTYANSCSQVFKEFNEVINDLSDLRTLSNNEMKKILKKE
ncbi:hypothetical protein [Leuconostoc mesenteroides]|uniref:hypothetical protein n=1 Tax=Leuconostoc mesenteroides TaxID=1245 RepID=UPI0030CD1C0F